MVLRLGVGRTLAGLSASTLTILLACWSMLQPRQARAQDAPAPPPPVPGAAADAKTPPALAGDDKWRHGVAAWRAEREQQIDAPDGWLTLVGLDWLKSGANSVGAAEDNHIRVRAKAPDHIGLLTVSGKDVQLTAPTGGFPPDLMVDGKPAHDGPLSVEKSPLSAITWHSVSMVVLNRGGRYVLSIRDGESPARTNFHGLNWYPPDPKYRVTATWTPYTPPRTVKIPTVLGTTLDLPSPGFVEFVLDGTPLNLEPVVEKGEDGTLFFILRDVTSEITSYGTARYLHTGLPDHGLSQPGHLTLDFNLLENSPCAYTTFASCPLPPDQNQLPVALEAGERLYTRH